MGNMALTVTLSTLSHIIQLMSENLSIQISISSLVVMIGEGAVVGENMNFHTEACKIDSVF